MNKTNKVDIWLISAAVILSLLGILAVWDAGYPEAAQQGKAIPSFVYKQAIFLGGSLVIAWAVSKIPAQAVKNGAWIFWWLTVVLLLIVEIPGAGPEVNGAKRWIDLKLFQLQPSELLKLSTIIIMAKAYAEYKPLILNKAKSGKIAWRRNVLPILGKILVPLLVLATVILVEQQPDMATAMVAVAASLVIMFFGGTNWKALVCITLGIILMSFVMVMAQDYRKDRFANHLNRWEPGVISDEGYQTTQSETALASGGLFGVGLGQGRGKHTVPAPHTDFILTTLSEEFGFLGSLAIISMLAFITYRFVRLSFLLKEKFDRLFMVGVATWIGVQSAVSIMMVNGALMPIGVPLPFVSYGGSSLLSIWLAIGVAVALMNRQERKDRTLVHHNTRQGSAYRRSEKKVRHGTATLR